MSKPRLRLEIEEHLSFLTEVEEDHDHPLVHAFKADEELTRDQLHALHAFLSGVVEERQED